MSQRKRKLVEEAFGWGKTIAGMAKAKVRELARVRFKFTFNGRLQSDPDAEAAGSRVKQTSRIGPAPASDSEKPYRLRFGSSIRFYRPPKFNSLLMQRRTRERLLASGHRPDQRSHRAGPQRQGRNVCKKASSVGPRSVQGVNRLTSHPTIRHQR